MNKFLTYKPALTLIASLGLVILGSVVIPMMVKPLFQGPDGTIWVRPFILWMGGILSIWTFLLGRKNGILAKEIKSNEWLWLSYAVVFLFGIFFFVGFQRFTSGLRGLEAFQDFMGYRVSIGNNIYMDPEAGVLGNHYTPLFFLLNSILYKIIPGSFGYGRIISMAATVFTSILLFKLIKRERGSEALGLWGVILYISTYGIMDKMYDWAQTDPLVTCLIFISLWHFLKNTGSGDMWALFYGGCACFTKQPSVIAFSVILLFSLFSRRRPVYYWPLLFWTIVGVLMLWMSDGRAWTYLASNPGNNGFLVIPHPDVLIKFFILQLPLWITLFINRKVLHSHRLLFLTLAQFAAAMAGVWKIGGWINNLFPFIPLLCFLAVGNARYLKWLWIIQIAIGLYNPFSTLYPWKTIRDVDRKMVSLGKQAEGEVWFPAQPYLAIPAEKPFWDDVGVLEAHCWAKRPAPARILNAIKDHSFSYILMRKEGAFWFPVCPDIAAALEEYYSRSEASGFIAYEPLKPSVPVDTINTERRNIN